MRKTSFDITMWLGPGSSYVLCRGEVDVCAVPALRAAVAAAIDGRARTVIVNGSGITLLAAGAVDVLCDAASVCAAKGVNFEITLSERGWKTARLLGAASLLRPDLRRDYEIPREVADALCDVMGERELYERFFDDARLASSFS